MLLKISFLKIVNSQYVVHVITSASANICTYMLIYILFIRVYLYYASPCDVSALTSRKVTCRYVGTCTFMQASGFTFGAYKQESNIEFNRN